MLTDVTQTRWGCGVLQKPSPEVGLRTLGPLSSRSGDLNLALGTFLFIPWGALFGNACSLAPRASSVLALAEKRLINPTISCVLFSHPALLLKNTLSQ